jgi:hypothetical protein
VQTGEPGARAASPARHLAEPCAGASAVRTQRMRFERASPRAHLVVDDFFTPSALRTIFREIASLDRHLEPGLVRDVGHDGQSVFFESSRRRNKAVWVHHPSKILRLFREHLWAPSMLPWFLGAREPLFQIIPNCWSPNLQVSRYMTGDHYDFHEDEGAGVNLTAIVFLAAKPEKVRGGNLTLAYGNEATTIRFRHNRLVIFPSKTLHRVTRVSVDSTDPRDARISLQSWLAYGQTSEGTKTKTTTKARPAEADRPTFLLAEEPIIGAAQALLASPEAAEQTPEELYWGAFYSSRILTQNLRWLSAEGGVALGAIRIRRVDNGEGGEDLEVYGRGRQDGVRVRIGFSLRGTPVAPAAAVRLFIESARGTAQAVLPSGADEAQTIAVLRRLLKGSSR